MVPVNSTQMLVQSIAAVRRALNACQQRQQIDFLLTVRKKKTNFMTLEREIPNTKLSLLDEFHTCVSYTKQLIRGLHGEGAEIQIRRIDSRGFDGEPCAVMYPKNKSIVAVVFPVADNLKTIETIADQDPKRPLLIINPQWQTKGQVVSDFGIGPWFRAAADFLSSFETTYAVLELRFGNLGSKAVFFNGNKLIDGSVLRLFRCYPDRWIVYSLIPDGSHVYCGTSDWKPAYESLLQAIRLASYQTEIMPFFRRGRQLWNKAKLGISNTMCGEEVSGETLVVQLSAEDVDAMDSTTLRKYLKELGSQSTGNVSFLRNRLKQILNDTDLLNKPLH